MTTTMWVNARNECTWQNKNNENASNLRLAFDLPSVDSYGHTAEVGIDKEGQWKINNSDGRLIRTFEGYPVGGASYNV